MSERVRFQTEQHNLDSHRLPEFLNPFSYMSSDDARVAVELWHRNLPWSYRYFDRPDLAPTVHQLIPDFSPEFTLSEYRTVIIVEGGFFGTLPGVLDKAALAKALLEHDGWKCIILFEQDIVHNLVAELDKQFPESIHPIIIGVQKPSPYGEPTTMDTRRQFLRGLALLRAHLNPKKVITSVTHTRNRHLHVGSGDSGRVRSISARYRSVPD